MLSQLNRGAVWPNDKKINDNSPDYKGDCNIDGVHCWVNMWIDPEATGGQPPIKFSLSAKEVQPEAAPSPASVGDLQAIKDLAKGPDGQDHPKVAGQFDDDIPF